MKNRFFLAALMSLTVSGAMAQAYKNIYPWTPIATTEFQRRLNYLTEGAGYISNIHELDKRNLHRANAKNQPWGGSFWPLLQGMVGNNYQEKNFASRSSDILTNAGTYFFNLRQNTSWKYNFKNWEKRRDELYPRIYQASEAELAELSPSEKYDLLMGDRNFTLTNVVWDYTAKRGEEKKIPFLRSVEMPEGYELGNESQWMAFWEGICHGWAPASGHFPRPERTVWVTLPNGKRMPFYPNDLKALISLLFANSDVQGRTLFEGSRCNEKSPPKDEYGRYYDKKIYKGETTYTPNCADVHPGVLHVALLNIMGIEGRSFVFDKDPEAAVANQPASGYEFKYFDPISGEQGPLLKSIVPVSAYKKDPFKASRNPDTYLIVGVSMKLKYTDWENPKAEDTNFPSDDKIKDIEFNYDLEMNMQGEIIGGQWRVNKDGSKVGSSNSGGKIETETHQPDFFWVIPRNWKQDFRPEAGLPRWDFSRSTLPPKQYADAALEKVHRLNPRFHRKCYVKPIDKLTGGGMEVDCITQEPGPQPLIRVIDTLLEESRK